LAKEKTQPVESGDQGAPAWMTTFSDCMTLLLTFFVLLLSFSSFDDGALRRISGAFDARPLPSIFENFQQTDDSLAPELESIVDRSEKGQQVPSQDILENTLNPKVRQPVFDRDAYDEEKTFYIPTRRLFLGSGSALTRHGRDYLASLATFMRAVPCQVVVGELAPTGAQAGGVERAWAVVDCLITREGLAPERFRLAEASAGAEDRFRNETVMILTLQSRDFTTE